MAMRCDFAVVDVVVINLKDMIRLFSIAISLLIVRVNEWFEGKI